ncbi:UNVERIFIED_CONTAM: Retrovirus-related Pol polyprotein from transposon TNT 1-94 [Sesamum angustifolium]|uniref:Retrovirus-related Pol polyprotein from transposon TNT 1-94 n=1 Tax=Sesamum angustifolium TaxID=2727405 RepID=A0AAW2IMT2_9LAMI
MGYHPLPQVKKVIGSRWVYKLKLNNDDTEERHKARLVSKGYNQIAEIDYMDNFSPVAKEVTIRTFLAVAATLDWHIHKLDINNAFLHDFLDEEIYVVPPEGYLVLDGHVCKLRRSLYGLKQASRQWNQEFTSKLVDYGFIQSKNDHCLFTKSMTNGFITLLVYVDDLLIAGTSKLILTKVKSYLEKLFTIKDPGMTKNFLGLEIARGNIIQSGSLSKVGWQTTLSQFYQT